MALSASQGAAWNSAVVDLAAYTGQEVVLRFNGVTGSTWQGDICIDNINISGASTFGLAVS